MLVIVIGMHRSGTSALAGLLHKHNIIMGEDANFIPKPLPENPKGFYENYLFREINDKIAGQYGYKIKSWDINIPHMRKANIITRYRMKKLLKKYNKKYKKWGWKDPRTCLTLDIWLRELKNVNLIDSCKILYIVRDPYAVAKSMVLRKNTTYENALKLWKIYNERALETINKYKIDTLYVSYEHLCNEPIKTANFIFKFIGEHVNENIVNDFIDKGLDNSKTPTNMDRYYIVSDETNKEIKKFKQIIYDKILA